MWKPALTVIIGGSLGCLLRWQLGLRLNYLFPSLPPGTLAANIVGCYIIGLAVAIFASLPSLDPAWRLFVITGFCGGLTTFSTFSAEVVSRLQEDQIFWAFSGIATHVAGSLLATCAGFATWHAFKSII